MTASEEALKASDDTNDHNHQWDDCDQDSLRSDFDKDGFVVLKNFLSQDWMEEWKPWSEDFFQERFQTLYSNRHTSFPQHCLDGKYALGPGVKHGFAEVVMRSPGRYELSLLENTEPATMPSNTTNLIRERVLKLASLLLKEETPEQDHSPRDTIRLSSMSLVIAAPGAQEQGWHADGGHMDVTKHLDCHCLNIFIPLQDVTSLELGPTELRPASHHLTRGNLAAKMLAAKARKTLKAPCVPLLKKGDVLAFDYRILHRGKANTTMQNRSILVFTYSKPWFRDVLNFPKRSICSSASVHDKDS